MSLNKNVIDVEPNSTTLDFGDFDDILEKSVHFTPGFEILGDMNTLEVKKRERRGGDDFLERIVYDVVGDGRRSLYLGIKEVEYNCFSSTITVSAFTDTYTLPVFTTHLSKSSTKILRVLTGSNAAVGYISKRWNHEFVITNTLEETELRISKNKAVVHVNIYEVFDSNTCVGTISCNIQGLYEILTIPSLSVENKVILIAFVFYLANFKT